MNNVGRYEITEKLGQGGMGTVYKAFDPLLTRVVAVKVILGQLDGGPEHRERFFREARAAAQLSHPNIITVYDLGEEAGAPYLAMEYLEGRDLDQRLHDLERISLTRKLELALSISEGLAHAHLSGLIHGDIKPANIFVTDDGVVKILDFGLARLITSSLTRSNVVVGTINYMAPEQLRGERADHRADIFSFGVLVYELLGGRKPFQGDSAAATIYKILHDRPQALDQLDPAIGSPLTTIVERAMDKAPEDRYQLMTDLLRDLEAAYESMRGADRRVISRVEAALRPPSGSGSPEPLDLDPDDPPTIFDETMWPRSVRATLLVAGVVLAGWLVVVAGELGAVRQSPSSVTEVSSAEPAPQATSAPPVPSTPSPPRPEPSLLSVPNPWSAAAAAREAELSVERTRATAALSLMEASKAAALSANARDLAPQIFVAGENEEAQAREDLRQRRFAATAGRLEATATLFRSAVAVANAESATRARVAEEGRRHAEQAAWETVIPPPAPVPAAPAPRSEPTPAPPQPTAEDAVRATLRRYTAALEQRDINALRLVWPGQSRPQQEAVEAEFANARSINVELASPSIEVTGGTATVTAVRHYSLSTRDGQQLHSDTAATVTMRKAASGWLIESVSHRPLP